MMQPSWLSVYAQNVSTAQTLTILANAISQLMGTQLDAENANFSLFSRCS